MLGMIFSSFSANTFATSLQVKVVRLVGLKSFTFEASSFFLIKQMKFSITQALSFPLA